MKIEDSPDKQREMIVILRCVADGKTAKEIGRLVNRSKPSIERKLRWLQEKLEVKNRAAMVHAGHCHGLLTVRDDERRRDTFRGWPTNEPAGSESGPPLD